MNSYLQVTLILVMESSGIYEETIEQICKGVLEFIRPDPSEDSEQSILLSELFKSQGLDVLDYPDAYCRFINSCNKLKEADPTLFSSRTSLKEAIQQLYSNIQQTQSAKIVFEKYLDIVGWHIHGFMVGDLNVNSFEASFRQKLLDLNTNHLLLQRTYEEVKASHYKIIDDDIFLELSSYISIKIHSENFITNYQDIDEDKCQYYELLKMNASEFAMNKNVPAHLKVLYRSVLLDDLSGWSFRFNKFVASCDAYPPKLIPFHDFELFHKVSQSSAFRQMLELFLQDTMSTINYPLPFANLVEEGEKFNEIVQHILFGNCSYYAPFVNIPGKSVCNFMFISSQYNTSKEDLPSCMRLLTIIHEAAHIYKRNNKGIICQNFSPIKEIRYERKTETKAEDGLRIETILLRVFYEKLYESTATAILDLKNWENGLSTFQDKLATCQAKGETKKEYYIVQRSGLNYVNWPTMRCQGHAHIPY